MTLHCISKVTSLIPASWEATSVLHCVVEAIQAPYLNSDVLTPEVKMDCNSSWIYNALVFTNIYIYFKKTSKK